MTAFTSGHCVHAHTQTCALSSHQVGNKIEEEDEDESEEDGSDEMLNLEDMDEDGDLEVCCFDSCLALPIGSFCQTLE